MDFKENKICSVYNCTQSGHRAVGNFQNFKTYTVIFKPSKAWYYS